MDNPNPSPPPRPVTERSARSSDENPRDELARVFNTALISTRASSLRDFSTELCEAMESPAFNSILTAVRHHARTQGLPERQAAEEIVRAFRKLDQIWSDYVMQEGIDRLRG